MEGDMPDHETNMNTGNEKDPTINVRKLLEDAIGPLKDLFMSEIRRVDERHTLLTEQMRELSTAESKRLDSIREVDATAAAAGPTSLQKVNNLAKVSVKTRNGLAIASVKTWDGLA